MTTPAKTGSYWALVTGLGLAVVLQPINLSMVVVSLPEIREPLGVSSSTVSWLLTGFIIGMAIGQPVAGKLIDRMDRRKVFIFGVVYFGLASVLAGSAWNFPALLAFRVNQSIGAAILLPTVMAIVRTDFPESRRAGAMGMIFGLFAIAGLLGPPLGGFLTSTFGWRSLFFINGPLAAIALVLSLRHVPSRPPLETLKGGFDVAGAAMLATGLLSLVIVVTMAPNGTLHPSAIGVLVATGIAALAIFVRHERRSPDPLMDVGLYRIRSFRWATLNSAATAMASFVGFMGVTLFLRDVRGLSPGETGLVLMAPAGLMIFVGPLSGRISDSVGRRRPIVVGTALLAVSLGLMALFGDDVPIWFVIVAMILHGLGVSIPAPSVQAAAVEACPERVAGVASGVVTTTRSAASVIGTGIVGGVAGSAAADFRPAFLIAMAACLLVLPAAFGVHNRLGEVEADRGFADSR